MFDNIIVPSWAYIVYTMWACFPYQMWSNSVQQLQLSTKQLYCFSAKCLLYLIVLVYEIGIAKEDKNRISLIFGRDFTIVDDIEKYKLAYAIIFENTHYIFVVKPVRKYEVAVQTVQTVQTVRNSILSTSYVL